MRDEYEYEEFKYHDKWIPVEGCYDTKPNCGDRKDKERDCDRHEDKKRDCDCCKEKKRDCDCHQEKKNERGCFDDHKPDCKCCGDRKHDDCDHKQLVGEACCQHSGHLCKEVYAEVRALFSTVTYITCQSTTLECLEIEPCREYEGPFCVKSLTLGDCRKYTVCDWKVVYPPCEDDMADITFTLVLPIRLEAEDCSGRCFTATGIVKIKLCLHMHVPKDLNVRDFEICPKLHCPCAVLPCLNEACVTGNFEITANIFQKRLVCLETCDRCRVCPSVPVKLRK